MEMAPIKDFRNFFVRFFPDRWSSMQLVKTEEVGPDSITIYATEEYSNITTSLKVSSQRIYRVYLIYGQNQLIICHFKWISPKSLEEKEIRYSHHLSA